MTSMQGRPAAHAVGGDGGGAIRRRACWPGSCDAMVSWYGLLHRGVPMGALSAVVVGIPTDVIPNALFSRMTPVRWWDYVVLALTAVMTVLWFAAAAHRTGARVPAATLLSLLAVGCPVCNKIAVALLGVSGALSLWAPMQPLLAVLSLFLAGTALWSRVVVVHRAATRSTESVGHGIPQSASPEHAGR